MKIPNLQVGMRYFSNLVTMVARQQGYAAAATVGSRFVFSEVSKLPKFAYLTWQERAHLRPAAKHPTMYSEPIIDGLKELGVTICPYQIDVEAFHAHVAISGYPPNYAAGPVDEGGAREKKLLEYFLSLEFLIVQPTDVIVDVASEWSIFPEVLEKLSGATVYRQDLIYPPGLHGNCIGGSAACMEVPAESVDKLVLHNAFEHFEGTVDTDFIIEAWRILRPGGILCILPLFLSERYSIVTDPLIDQRGVIWDDGACVIELPWHHNRFGRFYSPSALQRRVLLPALEAGFTPTIYHILNANEVHPSANMYFALVLQKQAEQEAITTLEIALGS
jgi:hypothetical protein